LSYFKAREATLREVLVDRAYSSMLGPTYEPHYLGSNAKYDYYQSGLTRYKVRTMASRFYPGPIPFKSWLWGKAYDFGLYNGTIVITPVYTMTAFQKYAHYIEPRIRAGAENADTSWHGRYLTALNQWYIQHLGQDRLRISSPNRSQSAPVMVMQNNCGELEECAYSDPRFFESLNWYGSKRLEDLYKPDECAQGTTKPGRP